MAYDFYGTNKDVVKASDFTPQPGYDASGQVISSSSLTPNKTDYSSGVSSPQYPSASPVTIPQLQATPQENQQSDIVKRLTEINTQLTQEPAYRQSQEQTQDITGKTQAVQDFYNQLLQIQGEQAALKAREAQIVPQRELAAQEGRSAFITEFTLGRQVEKQRRELAIEGLAISARAATTGALFHAAQGNLATAQGLVDKAVKDRFATQEAEYNSLSRNLTLIQNDPATTRAEKNRALQQEQSLKAQKDIQDQSKQNYAANLELANTLVKQGVQDTVLLQKIQEAKDANGNYSVAEAQRIAAESGLLKPERNTATREIGGRTVLYDTQTGETIKDLGAATSDTSSSYSYADELLGLNPDATYDDLKNELLRGTKLTSTKIDAYLASNGITKEKNVSIPPSILGSVKALISKNAPVKDVTDFITFSGYDVNSPEIVPLLKDYAPQTQSRVWWNPLTWF